LSVEAAHEVGGPDAAEFVHPLVWEQRPPVYAHLERELVSWYAKETFKEAGWRVSQDEDWGRFAVVNCIEGLYIWATPSADDRTSIGRTTHDRHTRTVQIPLRVPATALANPTLSDACDLIRPALTRLMLLTHKKSRSGLF
jgi:hypothetical protein